MYREVRRAFAMICTSIETSPNVCIGKPYLLKVLCREPACMVYCRAASGYASYMFIYSIGLISGHFYFCLVCQLAWKKKYLSASYAVDIRHLMKILEHDSYYDYISENTAPFHVFEMQYISSTPSIWMANCKISMYINLLER